MHSTWGRPRAARCHWRGARGEQVEAQQQRAQAATAAAEIRAGLEPEHRAGFDRQSQDTLDAPPAR